MPPYIKNTVLNFFSFFLIAVSLYIFISLVSYDISDSGFFNKNSSSNINNLGGPLGALISDFLLTLFGYGAYLMLIIGCVWAVQTLFYMDPYNSFNKITVRSISSIFLIVCFCSVIDFYFANNVGGIVGTQILQFLSSKIGNIGALIFLIIFLIPATSLSFNFSWLNIADYIGNFLIFLGKFLAKVSIKFIKNNYFIYSSLRGS